MIATILHLLKIHMSLKQEIPLSIYINGIYFDTIELVDNKIYIHHLTDKLDYSLDVELMNKPNLTILYDHIKSITMN